MAQGRWVTVFREKTCDTCRANHGQTREFADWANRPEGLPPIHPNCWCEIVPLEMEDDLGFAEDMVDLSDALADLDELDDAFDRAAVLRDIAGDIRRGRRLP
jgi:hypothetical protein